MVRNLPASAGDKSSIPGSGRVPGEGNGNPLQCSFFKKILAVLGLCPGLSLVVVHVLLIVVASLCCRAWALGM